MECQAQRIEFTVAFQSSQDAQVRSLRPRAMASIIWLRDEAHGRQEAMNDFMRNIKVIEPEESEPHKKPKTVQAKVK